MTEREIKPRIVSNNGEVYPLKFIEVQQVGMIDEAIGSVGEYGEVRLIVEKGRLRFLITQKSYDALKWRPGELIE
jgi:hypothetical protein